MELITNHSKEISNIISLFYLDYPMGSYIPKWKVFRAFTNENKTIAEHIANTSLWKKSELKKVLDIGTGDGLVLANLCLLSTKLPQKVTLVEPNNTLLIEAKNQIEELHQNIEIQAYCNEINQLLPDVFSGIDLVLIAHVLYLIPTNDMENIINSLPLNIPLIIVTDSRNSLFPKCWEVTAPKYFKRSQYIHKFIASLDRNKFTIKESSFKTYLKNPFKIDRVELMNSVLSLICYTDYENLSISDKSAIFDLVSKHSIGGLTFCNSICYEIVRIY
ncbi:MAG: class I SAM-dependent methyltransferase [Flavobacteriaceae bacterium]|nr:class I SAM-dependent methyltransferase [Flavobacteriaceae bacterium]